ncbi:MAG TPA: hypothetical protein PK829_10560, partial [Promineifilum sp.]|nr:hypothetical protein [Promineifilum sp.]
QVSQTLGANEQFGDLLFSADSESVFYSVYPNMDYHLALYRAHADGRGDPQRLGDPAARIDSWDVAPSGDRILYTAPAGSGTSYELYSAAGDGHGVAVRLSGPMVAGGNVSSFRFSPDESRVVYMADQNTDEVEELYGAIVPAVQPETLQLFLPVTVR